MTSADDTLLDVAFDALVRALDTSTQHVRAHPFFADPSNRVDAYAFIVRMLIARLEEEVIFDADEPYFRVLDHRIREGGDNPDQRYLITRLRGGATYRIWGRRGSARRLDLQIYAGDPYVAGSGGRAASFLTFEGIGFERDGTFEIIASPQRSDGNWIENPSDATRLLVRQIYSDWTSESPGEVHVDRVGHEGDIKPAVTSAEMADRLHAAAKSLVTHIDVWPAMVEHGYMKQQPPNQISIPFDPGTRGGVPGRWMSHAIFDLADDEALIVRTWPAGGNYQGIQLADLWFSSLEYANRQSSLTADQSHRSSDGSYYFVVAARDPGTPNWLDTVGHQRGVILLRYDGTTDTTFDANRYPTSWVVKQTDVRANLPADTPVMTAVERRTMLAERRRHIQIRYGV